ncbi:hypothetical protein PS834_00264 [Pseudomonas fluorescens]|jgi:hypothetical protein|nr:hypothetical protein PS834_00264 [Pseudomonas fluorescens]
MSNQKLRLDEKWEPLVVRNTGLGILWCYLTEEGMLHAER